MNINTLFSKTGNTILDSIQTYKKTLMDDMNLSIRLTYNNETYITHPIEWVDSIIIFEAPMKGVDDVILPRNLALNVILVSKGGLFHTTFTISKNYRKDNMLFYVAEITAPIIKKQQREAFRLDVLLDVQYEVIASENENTVVPTSGKATCLNISLGGMCLSTTEQLHSKDHLNLAFSLMDTPLYLTGEVLYLGEQTEQGTYMHRIRFIGTDTADTNKLNRLIFEKQRALLKHI